MRAPAARARSSAARLRASPTPRPRAALVHDHVFDPGPHPGGDGEDHEREAAEDLARRRRGRGPPAGWRRRTGRCGRARPGPGPGSSGRAAGSGARRPRSPRRDLGDLGDLDRARHGLHVDRTRLAPGADRGRPTAGPTPVGGGAGGSLGAMATDGPAPSPCSNTSAGTAHPHLDRPIVLVAFEGWSDAGDAASSAVRFLGEQYGAEPFATIDPEVFFDFSSTRPRVQLRRRPAAARSSGPRPRCRQLPHRRSADTESVTVVGSEPQLRWRTFSEQVVGVAQLYEARLVLTFGALLAEVPHTRPVSVFGTADDERAHRRARPAAVALRGPHGHDRRAAVGVPRRPASSRPRCGPPCRPTCRRPPRPRRRWP